MRSDYRAFIERLERALEEPLPGKKAQWKMAVHPDQDRRPREETYAYAGVLNLLFPSDNGYEIVFIKRRGDLDRDRHAGQISFPGGKYEEGDRNTRQTALRETEEEIGVAGDKIRLLGSLSSLFIPVSGFMVHPYVGFTEQKPDFTMEPKEVQEVFTAPVSQFLRSNAMERKDLILENGNRLENVPYYDLDGEILWGATAMMLSEFLELFRKKHALARHAGLHEKA